MVHKSLDERLAVTGILYKFGNPDGFISTVNTGDLCLSLFMIIYDSQMLLSACMCLFGENNLFFHVTTLYPKFFVNFKLLLYNRIFNWKVL